jgi:hypothetical protein
VFVLVIPPMSFSSSSQKRRRYSRPIFPTATGTGNPTASLTCWLKLLGIALSTCGGIVHTQKSALTTLRFRPAIVTSTPSGVLAISATGAS